MYYKKICKALLLIVIFSPAVAEQPVQDEALKTAFINPLSTSIETESESEKNYTKTREIQEKLTFYRSLIKGNSTLKSYQLQQEKLAAFSFQK